MKIAVLGTGMVGRALAARLAELGHEINWGTRDVAATRARTEESGGASIIDWLSGQSGVSLLSYAEAAEGAELIVNAVSGSVALEALNLAGAEHLAGKVLLDISNPLDFSAGLPPSLFVKDTDSLAETIQRVFPETRVVKALNTMSAPLMVNPRQLADGDHSTFIAGNDAEAKGIVADLLDQFGHRDVIDLGDLLGARGLEMLLPVWLRLWGTLGTAEFNFKIVR
ncbi:hypothetical protein FHU41_000638 [Psychromicrobium silvestre]|uniref:Pyrroline-5-carboxylate reductase catalytic N-terminal domain-containing protein n=1 Tax=Psychromicrobium silvestre TaxID=1645614 RepID=A0A7Y9S734_9MICC|nr:NAD(P)-binding domain-containing protein [Psychromicrobium silvestre]NYE94417.1 hypothetical protein [Psychromicrobium silvestre]